MTRKQEKTIERFEARAHLLGHEFAAYDHDDVVTMTATNPSGERMLWTVLADGAAIMQLD